MKLVPKLTLTILIGVFAVLAVFTAWRVRGEIETFDHEIRRDHRIIGLTAAAALSKTRTREEAIHLAQRIDASRERIGIRFVSLGGAADPRLEPVTDIPAADLPEPGEWIQLERPLPRESASGDFLLTYIAAPLVDTPHGAIELSESLTPRAAFVSRGVWSVLGSSAAMLVVCGLIVTSIGATLVGKPVAELIGAVRRIGAGKFDQPPEIARRDELGELASALRAMSSELLVARQKLTDDADARIRALEQLRHAERLATLGQLASVLAHEIGTPLNVISGHAKLLATGRVTGEDARESSSAICAQCERMTQIVRRILDYARRRPARRAWIQASDVIRQAHDLLTGLAEQRRVELVLDARDEMAELFADPGQLQQAVINLVLNAIQASGSGTPVHLGIANGNGAPGADAEHVVLYVKDQGKGIAPEVQSKIFEPFFTTKAPGEGTGLGLSVARDIIREHGGFVEVSSRPAEGSTFRIHLPRGRADAGPSISG